MRIAVHLDRARLFRWHRVLVDALRDAGHDTHVRFRDTSEPLPTSLTAILDFDRVRQKSGPERLSTRMNPDAFAGDVEGSASTADLTLDLSTSSVMTRIPGRVLRPTYDGAVKDTALFHALLDGRAPQLWVQDTATGGAWTIGLPALETPTRLAPSLDQTASRLIEGILRTLSRIAAGEKPPDQSASGASDKAAGSILKSVSAFAGRRTTRKLTNVRDKIVGNQPRWHVAWRTVPRETDAPDVGSRDLSQFRVLEDDGQRYFADPFVFVHEGVHHVFVEELPSSTGVGVISHVRIAADGTASAPRVVLSTGAHLSYPQVFARDGAIWMLPECAASGGLDLYRAESFPDRWVKHARLIDGRVHDATLFEHDHILWIAAGCEAFQSSTWDALSLFYADKLTGPWRPHAKNPVLIDARSARPAGPFWRDRGQLYRPAQDCSGGYGGKIAVKRVTKLSPEDFAEEHAGEISFDTARGVLGPHTIHRAGGVEVVDVYARPGALREAFRAGVGTGT